MSAVRLKVEMTTKRGNEVTFSVVSDGTEEGRKALEQLQVGKQYNVDLTPVEAVRKPGSV